MNEKLEKRNASKKKKPTFARQDSNKYAFKSKWRKPRGLHNKRRLNKKGHQKNPSIGYSSPKEVKYLTKEGLSRIIIFNIQDLEKVNKEKEIVVLSSKVGIKKKLQLLKEIQKKGLKVENIKNIELYIKEKESEFEERKKQKQKKISEKEKIKERIPKEGKREGRRRRGRQTKGNKGRSFVWETRIKEIKRCNTKKRYYSSKS